MDQALEGGWDLNLEILDRLYESSLNNHAWPEVLRCLGACLPVGDLRLTRTKIQDGPVEILARATRVSKDKTYSLPESPDGEGCRWPFTDGAQGVYSLEYRCHAKSRQRVAKSLELLRPHLERAIWIRETIIEHEIQSTSFAGARNSVAYGVAVVDIEAKLITWNREARLLCERTSAVSVRSGTLQLADPEDDRLTEALSSVCDSSRRESSGFSVTSANCPQRLQLLVVPLASIDDWSGRGNKPRALVLFNDLGRGEQVPSSTIAAMFQLTLGEARLAQALLLGHNLTEAANNIGISINTAKTHLKNIFQKTGVRRQAELVQMLQLTAFSAHPGSPIPDGQ